ncbi:MAG: ABC transporter permease [Eubacteriales bacterium]
MTAANNKLKNISKRGIGIIIIPLLCFAAMSLACAASGTSLFTGTSTWQLYFRGLTYVLLLAFGVSINMHTGRFDFSTGATMLIGGVIGAKIAYAIGAGPVAMILISAVFGAVFGCISGLLYVTLKLPPMIIGLGMTLVLEGIVAIITGGCKPVSFGTDTSYYRFAVNPVAMTVIIIISLAFMMIMFHYTKFGYDYRALQTGQKIAVGTGVNEKLNAVLCYTFAGLMFGAAGALSICSTNGVTPTINFSTIASMFSCFLPLFFSGFIEKYCNKQIAILLGCVSYEFIQIGFGQLSFMNASFTADVYKVVEAVILVVFLIYLNNENKIIELVMLKKLREKKAETAR